MKNLFFSGIYVIFSLFVLSFIWHILSSLAPSLPSIDTVALAIYERAINPFYDNGPNDKGIGIQLGVSLLRVLTGFVIGSLVAIPLGVLMGINKGLNNVLNPIVQLLRPVSPLAWFPVGLAALQDSNKAAVFTIAITSLWPILINTLVGVGSIPADYKNVAKVYAFPLWTYLLKVVLPYSLPYIFTGLRVGIGIAWMVIVASEMLAGGTGIGFFVWDSYNAGRLDFVLTAIVFIGTVGFAVDTVFALLIRRFSH